MTYLRRNVSEFVASHLVNNDVGNTESYRELGNLNIPPRRIVVCN